jgi:hypothetical protein
MRKHTSFAIAAMALAFAMTFCAWATSPHALRPQAGILYGAEVGSFLPVKRIEPAW